MTLTPAEPSPVESGQRFDGELIELDEKLGFAEALAEPADRDRLAKARTALTAAFTANGKLSALHAQGGRGGASLREAQMDVARHLDNARAFLEGSASGFSHDVQVDTRQRVAKVGTGSRVFEGLLWVFGLVPGAVFLGMRAKAKSYFAALDQRIQANASQIDNFLEQRVQVLQNVAPLVSKAVDLDREMLRVTAMRSGGDIDDDARNQINGDLDKAIAYLNSEIDRVPELKSQTAIASALRQNNQLQREITAARTLYNDTVALWNADIFKWPTKAIVAAEMGLTTRIPFVASAQTRELAQGTFF